MFSMKRLLASGFLILQFMFTSEQGAQAHCGYLCQRSYSTMGEAEIDHLRVPASRIATGQAKNRQVEFHVCCYYFILFYFVSNRNHGSTFSAGTIARQSSQEPSFDFPWLVHRSKIPVRLPQSVLCFMYFDIPTFGQN